MMKSTVNRITRTALRQDTEREMLSYREQFGKPGRELDTPDEFDEFLEEEERIELREIARQYA